MWAYLLVQAVILEPWTLPIRGETSSLPMWGGMSSFGFLWQWMLLT
jgi:hypothetical protein